MNDSENAVNCDRCRGCRHILVDVGICDLQIFLCPDCSMTQSERETFYREWDARELAIAQSFEQQAKDGRQDIS